jgi:hypothetical protein
MAQIWTCPHRSLSGQPDTLNGLRNIWFRLLEQVLLVTAPSFRQQDHDPDCHVKSGLVANPSGVA